ncbi:hypothetical protein ABH959_003251 [Bacillus sp. RC51]
MKLRQPRFRRKVPNPAGEKHLKDKSGSFSQEGYSYFDKSSFFYPALTGSKTPTSKFSGSKEVRWGINCP